MPATHDRPMTLARQLAGPLVVEQPSVLGSLSVFPIITDRSGSLGYMTFAQAADQGVSVKELDGQAHVNELVVHNPLEAAVLLYEGEEVLGAQQNRTFDISTLVPARASLRVPVTCVEAGRWQHERHDEDFAPAPQAAHPQLRQRKNERVRERLSARQAPRADQEEVWDEVAAMTGRHDVLSETDALHDVFEHHRALLDDVARRVPMHCSQVGMLAAIGGRFVVLDYVSDVEAFASLQPRLAKGYALDALDVSDEAAAAPSLDDARDFVSLLLGALPSRVPASGLGDHLSFQFGRLAGTALAHENELVTLTAFGEDDRPTRAGGVRRPSQRRRRDA